MMNRWFRTVGHFVFKGLVYNGLCQGFSMDRTVLFDLNLLEDDSIDREWAALIAGEKLLP